MRWSYALLLPAVFCLRASDNETVFAEHVAPVLKANCAACHTGTAAPGGLVISGLGSLLTGGKQGPALVPGNAAKSLLIQYVKGERAPKMPLSGSLAPETIASLEAAIDRMQPSAATPVNDHLKWLLRRPAAPAVPNVRNKDGARNPIDAFVLSKLEFNGLTPAPPAAPATLIRRLYFDLLGLPPPPKTWNASLPIPPTLPTKSW